MIVVRVLQLLFCFVLCLAAVGPATASASAPPLRGAATHPLWGGSTEEQFVAELDRLVDAGANVVRIDIGWSTLEQDAKGQRAEWYVKKADTFFAHARARGLRPIVTFWSTPCWASSAPDGLKDGCQGAWWDRDVDAYPPSDPDDLADAAAWVADRWGQDMAAIEIWNEPNYDYFFRSSTPAADYAPLLKSAYTAVKAVRPGLPVLGPAMVMSDGNFLEALYDEGIAGHFDGLSLRPFNQGRDPYDSSMPSSGRAYSYVLGVPWIREIMEAHGDGSKRMWFTELGWSSCAPGGISIWCVTEETQARYIADAFRIIRDRWDFVEAVSVYNLRNKGTNPDDRETQMGMLHRDFSPKPAYNAFRNVIAELAAPPEDGEPGQPSLTSPAPQPGTSQRLLPALDSGMPDRVRPALSRLAVSRRPASRSLAVRYRLSEPARVTMWVERAVQRRRCRQRCVRWIAQRTSIQRRARRGANHARFVLAALRPGRYRLAAYATDGAANRSAVRRTGFRVSISP